MLNPPPPPPQAPVLGIASVEAEGLHSPLTKHGGWPVVDGVATSYNSAAVVARNKYLVPLVEAVSPCLGRLVVAAVNPKPMHYIDGEVSPLSDTVPSLCHLYLSPLLPTPSPTLASLSAKGDRANLVARGRRCRGRHAHGRRGRRSGARSSSRLRFCLVLAVGELRERYMRGAASVCSPPPAAGPRARRPTS